MRLPRWLSSVRTIEAETGWPWKVCEQVAPLATGFTWRDTAALPLLIFVDFPITAALVLALIWVLTPEPKNIGGLALTVAGTAIGVEMFVALQLYLRAKARRFVHRYEKAPWCFNCKYPVSPPREPGAGSVCPECGEPIAPEIAQLAARTTPQARRADA